MDGQTMRSSYNWNVTKRDKSTPQAVGEAVWHYDELKEIWGANIGRLRAQLLGLIQKL